MAGALVAASTDLTFNFYGYVSVGLNDFLTALYLVMVKRSPATQGLTTTGILFYNAVLSMPALALALAVSKEPWHLLTFPDLYSKSFRVSPFLHFPIIAYLEAVHGVQQWQHWPIAFEASGFLYVPQLPLTVALDGVHTQRISWLHGKN